MYPEKRTQIGEDRPLDETAQRQLLPLMPLQEHDI